MNVDFESVLASGLFPAFMAAWQGARDGNALPLRVDIRLQEFAPFADSFQIFELKGPRDLRCRLMGSRIAERTPHVTPEDNVFQFFSEHSKATAEIWWGGMASVPCGGIMCFSAHYKSGLQRLVPSLILPITGPENRAFFVSYNQLPTVMKHNEPRAEYIVAEDTFSGQFLDVGFGLPAGIDNPLVL